MLEKLLFFSGRRADGAPPVGAIRLIFRAARRADGAPSACLAARKSKFFRFQKEKVTRPYHFKKFDFPKGIPLQKSNFLKR